MDDLTRNTAQNNVLINVKEGMDVVDVEGKHVGTVSYVQFGDEDPTNPNIQTVTGHSSELRDDSLVDEVAKALVGEGELPDTMRGQLLRYGFIRINSGFLRRDRFATADQVVRVVDETVGLNVRAEALGHLDAPAL
jgi:hypothetical protein